MFCHSNTATDSHRIHTHTRAQPAVVNEMKKHIEVVALFLLLRFPSAPQPSVFLSLPLTVYFVAFVIVALLFCVNFVERLINSNLRVRYYN